MDYSSGAGWRGRVERDGGFNCAQNGVAVRHSNTFDGIWLIIFGVYIYVLIRFGRKH